MCIIALPPHMQVRPMESFASVAERTGMSVGQLIQDNLQGVKNLDQNLPVGRRLRICKSTKGGCWRGLSYCMCYQQNS
jgi:hypothetical protein